METTKLQTACQLIFCLMLAIVIQTNFYLVGDNSWLLHVTNSLLHGGRYYQDFFETNPPMILYLYTPAVLLVKFSHLSLATGFRIYIFLLTIISLIACNSLLKKIFAPADDRLRRVALVTIAFALWLLVATELGEREHVMIILVLPYLLSAVLRAQSRGDRLVARVGIGLAAGLGLALKPYFLLAPLLIEIYLLCKTRKLFFFWRAENIAVALVLVLYLISIIIFTPEYFSKILPLVNDLYFPGLPVSLWQMFIGLPVWSWLLLLSCYWLGRDIQPYREFDDIFFLAATAFVVCFIVQRANWYYHWLPALTTQLVLLTKIFASNASAIKNNWRKNTSHVLQTIAACFVLIVFIGNGFISTTCKNILTKLAPDNFIKTASQLITQHTAPGSTIYFFFPFVSGAYPLIDYVPASSASRFPGLVFLPGLYKKMLDPAANKTEVAQKKQWLIDMVLADFYRQPPALVFVDKRAWRAYFGDKPFDYIKFFSSDPAFNKIFNTCYSHLVDLKSFAVYQNKCAELPDL
jgi:hypothetical protein